jgi:hypothetical protein
VLVLLMGVIYDLHHSDDLRWHDTPNKIPEYWFEYSGNIKVITSKL